MRTPQSTTFWLFAVPTGLGSMALAVKSLIYLWDNMLKPAYTTARSIHRTSQVILDMSKQFGKNGGSTLKDVVEEIKEKQVEQKNVIEEIKEIQVKQGETLARQDEMMEDHGKILHQLLEQHKEINQKLEEMGGRTVRRGHMPPPSGV